MLTWRRAESCLTLFIDTAGCACTGRIRDAANQSAVIIAPKLSVNRKPRQSGRSLIRRDRQSLRSQMGGVAFQMFRIMSDCFSVSDQPLNVKTSFWFKTVSLFFSKIWISFCLNPHLHRQQFDQTGLLLAYWATFKMIRPNVFSQRLSD